MPKQPADQRIELVNRKAWHDYQLSDRFEVGIELKGTEVKSLRAKQADLTDSFARVEQGQVWLHNCRIEPYKQGSYFNPDPTRQRRLLLHRNEISKLSGATQQRGFTLVPTKLYFNRRGLVKVELALAKGRLKEDRRRAIKEREQTREIERALARRRPR